MGFGPPEDCKLLLPCADVVCFLRILLDARSKPPRMSPGGAERSFVAGEKRVCKTQERPDGGRVRKVGRRKTVDSRHPLQCPCLRSCGPSEPPFVARATQHASGVPAVATSCGLGEHSRDGSMSALCWMECACDTQRFRGFRIAHDFRDLLCQWQGSFRNFSDGALHFSHALRSQHDASPSASTVTPYHKLPARQDRRSTDPPPHMPDPPPEAHPPNTTPTAADEPSAAWLRPTGPTRTSRGGRRIA